MPRQRRLRGPAEERRLAAEHFVENARERVSVRSAVDLPFATGLFGAHVIRRAHGQSRDGQLSRLRGPQRTSDPKVGDHRVTTLEEYVRRLDVPVDDVFVVSVLQRISYLVCDSDCVCDGQAPLARESVT